MSKDFKKMNSADLQKTLTEKREKLLNVRFSVSGSQSKKTAEVRTLKKEVAQILTILNETK